ncbi:hypothetical protein ACFFRR_001864 [Megaselia abdita]
MNLFVAEIVTNAIQRKMKFQFTLSLLVIALVISPLCRAECIDNENDGDVKNFFKKLGCNIQEGAEKIAEKSKPYVDSIRNETSKLADKAKPYVDSIGNEASKLADSTKQFGSDAVHKFNEWRGKVQAANNETVPVEDKVDGEGRDNFAFPEEPTTPKISIDDRFLLDGGVHCKEGERYVENKGCRKVIDS